MVLFPHEITLFPEAWRTQVSPLAQVRLRSSVSSPLASSTQHLHPAAETIVTARGVWSSTVMDKSWAWHLGSFALFCLVFMLQIFSAYGFSKFWTKFLSQKLQSHWEAVAISERFSVSIWIGFSELIQAMPIFSTGGPKKIMQHISSPCLNCILGYVVMYYNIKSLFLVLFSALQKNPDPAVFTVSVQDQASISSHSSNDC